MKTEKMLELWMDITGINPQEERKSWVISSSGKLSNWDIKKMNDKLMEVVKFDVDGVFTKIFLRHYFDEFLKGKSVSFLDYLNDKKQYTEFFMKCEELKSALSEVDSSEKTIMNNTYRAIEFYNIKDANINIFDIAYLRISAKANIDNLNIVQFKRGLSNSDKPKYARDVYMVNNINTLIKTIEQETFDGISLNYIYDSDDPASSYFAFIIKNGQNIFFMSDKPSYKHPNQKYMTRAKGRNMAERIDKTYFPYSLTNLDIDKYGVKDSNSNNIAETGYIKIGSISDMETSEALWTINMFSLIQEKFFTGKYECKELSYIGGMVQHVLLENKNNSLTVYDTFEKISLPIIDKPDEIELEYDFKSLGLFKNTIERLKDKVDISLINSISYSDKVLLEEKSNSISFRNSDDNMLSLNLNEFGTREELEYRQKWIARYNFAKQINNLAKKEYDESIDKVKEWYVNAIWKNINNILDMVIYEQLKGDSITYSSIGIRATRKSDSIVKKFTIEDYRENKFWKSNRFNQSFYGDNCCFTGKKASLAICIFANNIDDIMLLTGCKEDEIPVVLRDWSVHEKSHGGNCILDNIDPCDWVIKDHWHRFSGQIDILLSKTVYNELYKERGLHPDNFWLNADLHKA